jgi:hypothetical protein
MGGGGKQHAASLLRPATYHSHIDGLCRRLAPWTRAGGPPPAPPLGPFRSLRGATTSLHGRCRRLAPWTRAGGPPPAPPLGPFHFPRPLEIQAFVNADVSSLMPFLAPAAHDPLPIGGIRPPAQRSPGHELVDRPPHQKWSFQGGLGEVKRPPTGVQGAEPTCGGAWGASAHIARRTRVVVRKSSRVQGTDRPTAGVGRQRPPSP